MPTSTKRGKAGDDAGAPLRFRSEVDRAGFTVLHNCVLYDNRLNDAAKVTYAVLCEHARKDDGCFPGQERLAELRGCSDRTIRNHLTDLERVGLISTTQRGQASNWYWIESIEEVYGIRSKQKKAPAKATESDRKKTSTLDSADRKNSSDRKKIADETDTAAGVIYNSDADALNVRPRRERTAPPTSNGNAREDGYRLTVLGPVEAVEALTEDDHSRQRYIQLRELCLEHRATDAWDSAIRSTERRKRRPDLSELRNPGSWFDSAVTRELEKRGVTVPKRGQAEEAAGVRDLIGASLASAGAARGQEGSRVR